MFVTVNLISLFPLFTLLGPVDRFLDVLGISGHFRNKLVADGSLCMYVNTPGIVYSLGSYIQTVTDRQQSSYLQYIVVNHSVLSFSLLYGH